MNCMCYVCFFCVICRQMTGFRHLCQLIPSASEKSTDRYRIRTITQGDNWQVDDDILIVDEVILISLSLSVSLSEM
jgi:hypothetical protein